MKYLIINTEDEEITAADMQVKDMTEDGYMRFLNDNWNRDMRPPLVIPLSEIKKVIKGVTNYCDHGHETKKEVRLLPYGADGNMILCHDHYVKEITARRLREHAGFEEELPEWHELRVYNPKS